uniref:Fatty acid binding protein 1b, tandem duplicate 1 n=1 Tax=Gouania willdenowi TaxID=441366 RepID=A0A8C5HAG4_GOUWI
MSFSGKYQLESQENFVPFMKALVQKGKDLKSISEIEENGDNFKVTITTGTQVLSNNFTIGQESELDTMTGGKVMVSENTLSVLCLGVESVTELVDKDTIVNVSTAYKMCHFFHSCIN